MLQVTIFIRDFMAITHRRSGKKPTGGKLNIMRKKKKRDFGTDFSAVKIGSIKRRVYKTIGSNSKVRILEVAEVNVTDLTTGKTKRSKILTVKQNPANPNYVRMNVITLGATVETEMGLVKITSRPGQHGIMNGVLVK